MVNYKEMFKAIDNYRNLNFEDFKFSYLIVKPNGIRHFKTYVDELISQKFVIADYYAIHDYETINIALHPTEKEQRHIVPINNMFNTLYSNNAVLIIIAKSHITYEDFVKQVHHFKSNVRQKFENTAISYVFDIAELLNEQQNQLLKIIDTKGNECPKREMNHKGTFLVFSVNSLHSPDPDVDVTISELKLLQRSGIFEDKNIIPAVLVKAIIRYETFAFLKDM